MYVLCVMIGRAVMSMVVMKALNQCMVVPRMMAWVDIRIIILMLIYITEEGGMGVCQEEGEEEEHQKVIVEEVSK